MTSPEEDLADLRVVYRSMNYFRVATCISELVAMRRCLIHGEMKIDINSMIFM